MQLWVFDSILFSGRRIFSSSYKYVEFEEFEMEGVQWLQWLQTANDWSKAVETELFCHFASQYHHLKVYLSQIVKCICQLDQKQLRQSCSAVLLRNTTYQSVFVSNCICQLDQKQLRQSCSASQYHHLSSRSSFRHHTADAWSAWTPGRTCISCSFSGWFLFQASLKLATLFVDKQSRFTMLPFSSIANFSERYSWHLSFFAKVPFGIAHWGRTRVGMGGQMRPLEQLGGVFPTYKPWPDSESSKPLFVKDDMKATEI